MRGCAHVRMYAPPRAATAQAGVQRAGARTPPSAPPPTHAHPTHQALAHTLIGQGQRAHGGGVEADQADGGVWKVSEAVLIALKVLECLGADGRRAPGSAIPGRRRHRCGSGLWLCCCCCLWRGGRQLGGSLVLRGCRGKLWWRRRGGGGGRRRGLCAQAAGLVPGGGWVRSEGVCVLEGGCTQTPPHALVRAHARPPAPCLLPAKHASSRISVAPLIIPHSCARGREIRACERGGQARPHDMPCIQILARPACKTAVARPEREMPTHRAV